VEHLKIRKDSFDSFVMLFFATEYKIN